MKVVVTGGEAPPGKPRSEMQVMAMRSAGKMWPIIKPMTLANIHYYKAGHIAGEVVLAMKGHMDVKRADSFDGADLIFVVTPCPPEIIDKLVASGTRFIQV